jgi:hypothetical protein
VKQRDIKRLQTAEMKLMRRTAGHSLLDRTRNEDILEELKADPDERKLVQHKQNRLHHVSRMEDITYTKELDYRKTKTGTTVKETTGEIQW